MLGGVRLHPVDGAVDLGGWVGGRLTVRAGVRGTVGVGPALVRAACARAEAEGALRFEATVQPTNDGLFVRLGWRRVREVTVARCPHLLGGPGLGGAGCVGDDGAPVPGSDLVAVCDAIVPSTVERDPEWAGWCSVLVNVNDLAAMGADPVGLRDAIGARDASCAAGVVDPVAGAGVSLRWHDGELTRVVSYGVTGLGAA